MTGGLTFLSWVREGLGADGGAPDPLSGALPARTTVTLHPRVNTRDELTVPARLFGPGDVTGIDPRQVLQVFPPPGTPDAEPHLFASVEFDRPDLPWMFSPAAPDGQGRLRPWLALVVVEDAHASVEPSPGGGLPRLTCDPDELPDLAESWGWAHAQVVTDGDLGDGAIDALLTGDPDRTLSRLLCPRRLASDTSYLAAVVPAFEAGRLSGLGRDLPAADRDHLRPAWPPLESAQPWQLPVYHHWRFTTGLDGDFESLVRDLTPRALPGKVGTRPLDVGRAGNGLPELREGAPGRIVDLQGALATAGTEPLPWHAGTADDFADAYTEILDGSAPASGGGEGPELTPPVYGAAQAGGRNAVTTNGGTKLPSPQAGPYWLRELNLDPRHRVAAALGGEVVRRHQEDLVAAAWDQAAEIRRANDALRQGQLARTVADSLHRRLAGAAGDDRADARLLQITAAARAAVAYGAGTAAGETARNQEAAAALSPPSGNSCAPAARSPRRPAPPPTPPPRRWPGS
ncbi:hypothetical protein WJ438_03205 [Streptomyces sp. GD-15H]|uniref:hypothetical protein n=1 Tax=Streptomyces sp. GD-15H TaxID=3129112 RepID=UPI00324B77A2